MRAGPDGSSERMAVPMLPPTWASQPAQRRGGATRSVVVDLPLFPVMATKGASEVSRRRSRQNSSTSPITSTPAARARRTDQCGVGCVSGTPGASTSASARDQSVSCRSAVGTPALVALATTSASSSHPITSAPPARTALALASPEPPSPNTATLVPAKVVTRITGLVASTRSSPQLEGGKPGKRQHHGDDPEPDHDLRLRPAELLEVMMDGRHAEHALTRELVREHLYDHRDGFQDEEPADDRKHDLVLGGDRDGADHAAERERAGIAHEDRSRGRVEPEESQPGADHGTAKDGKLASSGNVMNVEVGGEKRMADEIGNEPEAERNDDHGHGRQSVEPVREVHGIPGTDNDETAENEEEPAERDDKLLEERNGERCCERLAPYRGDEVARKYPDQHLEREAEFSRNTGVGLLGDLEIIVVETDGAERNRHPKDDQHIPVRRIGPHN